MPLIYQRDGSMANSKFNMALLKPINGKNTDFESKLKPIDDNEDEGAYLDNLPEQEGALSKLPRNILIGLSNLGHSTLNSPHDITEGAENLSSSFDKFLANHLPISEEHRRKLEEHINSRPKLSEIIPTQQEHNYAELLGQPGEGTLMDKIIQKGVEYAPEIVSGKAILKGGLSRLKGAHHLNQVEKAVYQKGLKNFTYPEKMIKQSQKYLPNTEATKELIDAVQAGDYKAAFKLQSQVGHHQRKLARSPLASENSIMAPKAAELKQNMLGHLEHVLRAFDNIEEADWLRTGIKNYAQYKKVMDVAKPILKKLRIPTSMLAVIGLGYNPAKKLAKELMD